MFGLGSLLSALAPALGVLIAFRAVLGAVGAACVPSSMAMIARLYPDGASRARAVAAWAAISGAAVAAGPVGATAGQIGKKLGMRVVGIAGGPKKCAWLKDEAGFDAVIDYKAEPDLTAAIRAACPEGVDVL